MVCYDAQPELPQRFGWDSAHCTGPFPPEQKEKDRVF